LYPDSFSDYIKAAAKTNNIKPELISSIIRQESIFDPKIVSPVGAIGLMQIMPYTGEEIANDLKEEFILDSLYEPACNVRYGSYYIKKLIDKFNGDYILAIAGYNGGPHNAKKWKAQNKDDDFDMFIEDIGFTETRKYVKKVLGNYWTYKLLKSFGTYYLY
jgi:soluble lytic murein transglycosylase